MAAHLLWSLREERCADYRLVMVESAELFFGYPFLGGSTSRIPSCLGGRGEGLSLKRNLQAKLAFFHADLNLFRYWHLWWALCRCFGISLTGVHQKNKYIQ